MWIREEKEWTVLPLASDRYEIAAGRTDSDSAAPVAGRAPVVLRTRTGDSDANERSAAILVRSAATGAGPEAWSLVILDEAIRINGRPVGIGLRRLRDRDELRLPGGERSYFSTECQAEIVPYPRADGITCPRCKTKIAEGEAAVRCPDCAIWYHQTDDRPCYTYSPTCGTCPRASDLDAGFRWTPEGL
jgi:hypothetical protein